MATLANIVDQIFRGLLGQNIKAGRDYQLVSSQRSGWRDDVNRLADGTKRLVIAEDFRYRVVFLVVALPVDGPAAIIRMQNRDFRFGKGPCESGSGFGEFCADLFV